LEGCAQAVNCYAGREMVPAKRRLHARVGINLKRAEVSFYRLAHRIIYRTWEGGDGCAQTFRFAKTFPLRCIIS
jgi:hypothetical protein